MVNILNFSYDRIVLPPVEWDVDLNHTKIQLEERLQWMLSQIMDILVDMVERLF